MRLLICGDRNWLNEDFIEKCILFYKDKIEVLIEGEARGADKLSRKAAEKHQIPVLPFPAEWDKFHKAAGPIRNSQMMKEGKPTHVWGYHNYISESSGTLDMLSKAVKAGLPTTFYFEDDNGKYMKVNVTPELIQRWKRKNKR